MGTKAIESVLSLGLGNNVSSNNASDAESAAAAQQAAAEAELKRVQELNTQAAEQSALTGNTSGVADVSVGTEAPAASDLQSVTLKKRRAAGNTVSVGV
jgi:hypothetical protein